MPKEFQQICRNTENDRVFPFAKRLAQQKWIEVLRVPKDFALPEVLSEHDKAKITWSSVDKKSLPQDDYEGKHWTWVKKQVEERGGVWTSAVNGVDYLRRMDRMEAEMEAARTATTAYDEDGPEFP